MAYSILATTDNQPNWEQINTEIFDENSSIEMFPGTGNEGTYTICISIPLSKLNNGHNTWEELEFVISNLQKLNFKLYDLYNGFYIDSSNIEKVKSQIKG